MKPRVFLVYLLLFVGHWFSPTNTLPSWSQLASQYQNSEKSNLLVNNQLDLGNILPLGDSITQGETGRDSYRFSLNQKLLAAGYQFDFVGSMNQTADCNSLVAENFDTDHEGHWGWRIDDIIKGRQTRCYGTGKLADWLANYMPDLVLIHLGTNDVFQGSSVDSSIAELKQVVQILRQKNPQVAIFLAQLIPTSDPGVNQAIAELNQAIAVLVNETDLADSPVILVSQNSDFNPASDTYDGVHPNSQGEQKIAQKWFDAIETYAKSRLNNSL